MGNLRKPCGVIQQRSCWTSVGAAEEFDKQEICAGVTLRTLHPNNTHQSHLPAAFTSHIAFIPPLYLIRGDGFGNPRPNRRSGAWSWRCETGAQEEEKKKKGKNENIWRKSSAAEVEFLTSPGF